MAKLTVKDIELNDKKVLVRCDFNVPQDENLNITDDRRIKAALPTIEYILSQNPKKLILASHLGRPKGKVVDKYSLKPVAKRLAEFLNQDVLLLNDCIGEEVVKEITESKQKIVLLENLRFHAEEEKNDSEFAKKLSLLADVYVNDAFGTAHRAHASTEGVTRFLRSAAGFLLKKEIDYLSKATGEVEKPYYLILGGAKVSDKIPMIENLIDKVDKIIIAGGMAYTFLKAKGVSIGSSKLEAEKLDLAKSLLDEAEKKNVKIVLPIDHVVSDKFDKDAESNITDSETIPDGMMALDIGPKSIELFNNELKDAKTIVWNGPLGVFEMDKFAKGTREVAIFIGKIPATTIIGGGDTAAAIAKFNLDDKMSHISTGGGASLEFLEGKLLPGIEALTEKE